MKSIGLARLGRDAEVRSLPSSGDKVANLSLAVTYYGQKDERGNLPTQWIEASLWGKQAEALAPYLKKGTVHCFALSDIHIEQFEGRNGTGHKLVARCDSVELGLRQGDGNSSPSPAPTAGRSPSPAPAPRSNIPDDDIPF